MPNSGESELGLEKKLFSREPVIGQMEWKSGEEESALMTSYSAEDLGCLDERCCCCCSSVVAAGGWDEIPDEAR